MLLHVNAQNWLWLIVTTLAAWRLSVLLCFESGPFNSVTYFRILLYKIRLGSLIDCFHCTSFWMAIILTWLVFAFHLSSIFLAVAVAGGASIIQKLIDYGIRQEEPPAGD